MSARHRKPAKERTRTVPVRGTSSVYIGHDKGPLIRSWFIKNKRIRFFAHEMGIAIEPGTTNDRVVFRWGDLCKAAQRIVEELKLPHASTAEGENTGTVMSWLQRELKLPHASTAEGEGEAKQ